MSVAEGMREQLEHRGQALERGARHLGWKIGMNIPEVQRQLGIEEPVLGHLTSETVVEPGGEYPAGGASKLMAEPEVAIEVGQGETIARVAAAIELVDIGRPLRGEGVRWIVADNVFHCAVVFGEAAPRERAEPVHATVWVNGEERASSDFHDDLGEMVGVAARRLAEAGERLRPGDRIIAGSITPQVGPLSPGDALAVEVAGLGRLEVTIAA